MATTSVLKMSTTKNMKTSTDNDGGDIFDDLIYRSTPGAPLSFDEKDAVSMNLASPTEVRSAAAVRLQSQRRPLTNRIINQVASQTAAAATTVTSNYNNNTANMRSNVTSIASPDTPTSKKLPKVLVNLRIHEEVSSTIQTETNNPDDAKYMVHIDGSLHAEVQSSYTSVNPSFILKVSDPDTSQPDDNFMNMNKDHVVTIHQKDAKSSNKNHHQQHTVTIPKNITTPIQLGSYHRAVTKQHMPLLLERKVIRSDNDTCLLTVQLRSNLNNKGNLKDITLCIAIPPTVISETLRVRGGQGSYDALKRLLKFRTKELKAGQSCMYCAEVKIAASFSKDESPSFPIMLRCSSTDDTVSNLEVDMKMKDGFLATFSFIQHRSLRLIYRLPC